MLLDGKLTKDYKEDINLKLIGFPENYVDKLGK